MPRRAPSPRSLFGRQAALFWLFDLPVWRVLFVIGFFGLLMIMGWFQPFHPFVGDAYLRALPVLGPASIVLTFLLMRTLGKDAVRPAHAGLWRWAMPTALASLICGLVLFALYAYTGFANAILDRAAPVVTRYEVVARKKTWPRPSSNGRTPATASQSFVSAKGWGEQWVLVSGNDYDLATPYASDLVVTTGEGAFGMPWVRSIAVAARPR